MPRVAVLTPVALLCCFPAAGTGDDKSLEAVRRGKAATALVVLPEERGFGSAFCVDPAGFFITNEHVVRNLPTGKTVSLVLRSGDDGERLVEATVVRADAGSDLALLGVASAKDLAHLEIGDVQGLTETMQVTAFGYPFGDRLAVKERKYPSISVNVGRITALRRARKELEAIQLDAQLNPGNSGGPVLDATGQVVGVVTAGVRGSGVNFAVPASRVTEFLRRPEVVFAPAPIPYARRHETARFTVRLVSFVKPAPKATVEQTLGGSAKDRAFKAEPGADGVYTVAAAPIPAPAGPPRVPVTLIFPAGRIQGSVPDQTFQVGAQKVRLSEVREITPGPRPTVSTRAGPELTGPLSGLGSASADFGGYAATVDLGRATRIVVSNTEEVVDQVDYTVVVKEGDKFLTEVKGAIRLEGRIGTRPAAGPRVEPPVLASGRMVIDLPAAFDNVWVGGGGRYVVLHLKRLNKLAVFDVSAAKVIQYLPAPAEAVLGAAGAEHLVLVVPGKKTIERWSLRTLEKEATAPLPVEFKVDQVALGSASFGPVLVWGETTNSALLDLNSLKKIGPPLETAVSGRVAPHDLRIEAAPDGSAFTMWFRRQHMEEPSKFRYLTLDGGRVSLKTGESFQKPCLASIDGGPVFTGEGNVYTAEMQPIAAPELKGATLLPVGSSYVVAARWEGAERKARLAVHFMAGLREAFPIGEVEELDGLVTDRTDPAAFTYDKRIQFVPSANVLLTLPATNDRIVVRRIDVDAALQKSGVGYLFVSSVPVRQATAGSTYVYQIEVKAKSKDVRYDLDSGPSGMSLSRTGRVTWDVPPQAGDAAVIVSISDGSGQKIYHSFTIRVR